MKFQNFFIALFAFLFFQIHAHAEAIPKRWMTLLKSLVETNSGTENSDGLDQVRKLLVPEFKALGFEAKILDLGKGHKIVSFDFPASKPEVLLLGHLDTVFPKESKFQKLEEKEGKLIGPGVMDMKGGIVLLLNVLSEMKNNESLKKIRIVLNDDEEIGSPFSKDSLKELAAGIHSALIFEPGLPGNGVITSQSGVYWVEISVKGKAAHAGNDHAKGVNACVELAHQIGELSKLTDYKKHFTVNVGVISGGTKPNVVCEEASAKLDVRFVNDADLVQFKKKLDHMKSHPKFFNSVLKQSPTISVQELVSIPSMPDRATAELYRMAKNAATMLGQNLNGQHVGFASDANQLAPTGIRLLVGVGPIGESSHSENESLTISSFADRVKLTRSLLESMLR